MTNKYEPDKLKEEAVMNKFLLDTARDIQALLQLLIEKGIITKEELDIKRDYVMNISKYKDAYAAAAKKMEAFNLYNNDPQAYLKALWEEKLKGN